jgi:hypothetical protein
MAENALALADLSFNWHFGGNLWLDNRARFFGHGKAG